MKVRVPDRVTGAVVAGAVVWLAVGGQLGMAAGLATVVLVAFPKLLRGLRPTGRQADTRPAVAALAGAVLVVAVFGAEHLTLLLTAAALAAAVVWAWPMLRRGAHRARPVVAGARQSSSGRARIRGNHHGRPDVVEEVPGGRVGISRKRGGDGPSRIELCARYDSAGKLVTVAERRHVHARWRVASAPKQCPLHKGKRHWQMRAVGRATRKR